MKTIIIVLLILATVSCSAPTEPKDDHVDCDTITPLDHDSIVKFARPILSIKDTIR